MGNTGFLQSCFLSCKIQVLMRTFVMSELNKMYKELSLPVMVPEAGVGEMVGIIFISSPRVI